VRLPCCGLRRISSATNSAYRRNLKIRRKRHPNISHFRECIGINRTEPYIIEVRFGYRLSAAPTLR
jgi:hypothetical protein